MPRFSQPVADYMTREVEAVSPDALLPSVVRALERVNISAVPVVQHGTLIGVISRTDLLHVGRLNAGTGRRPTSLTVPDLRVGEVMKRNPLVVAPHLPLAEAARIMHDARVHRVFVVESGAVIGVLSTLDLAAAVRDARLETPLAEVMSSPIFSVDTTDPLSLATERLELDHVTGLIVLEDGWPVGVFTQSEAMAARDLPRDTRVDDVFDQAVICLPDSTRLFRAAAHAARLDVRRVVACRQREAVGVLSGLDFARIVASD